MGKGSTIEWTDGLTFNPWIGCTKVSPACERCYAARLAVRFGVTFGPHQPRKRTAASTWRQPLAWDRRAAREGARPFVFGGSLCDVFDNAVDPAWRADYFELIRSTPNLVWLLLTKRPGNIVEMAEAAGGLPPNVALGCTVVTQEEAERDVPKLLAAKLRLLPLFAFLSVEPMLGPIDLAEAWAGECALTSECWGECGWCEQGFPPLHNCQRGCQSDAVADLERSGVDWVICGGESGPGARAMHPDWPRHLRDDCAVAGVPFFFKQWGDWAPVDLWNPRPGVRQLAITPDGERVDDDVAPQDVGGQRFTLTGKKAAGRLLDGREHNDRPTVPPLQVTA